MARRRQPEEHVNHERWLVSYADFITLLFAFFVVIGTSQAVNLTDGLDGLAIGPTIVSAATFLVLSSARTATFGIVRIRSVSRCALV